MWGQQSVSARKRRCSGMSEAACLQGDEGYGACAALLFSRAKKVSKNALCPSTSAPLLSQGQFIFLFVFCIGVFQPESALFSPTAVGAAGVGRLFSLLRHADLRWNQRPPAWGKDSASHCLLRSIYSEETEAQWFRSARRAHAKSTDTPRFPLVAAALSGFAA